VESLGDPGLRLRVLERDPTTLEEALKVASRLEALGYGELEHNWDDVGRRRDKFVKTTVGSKNYGEQQLTGMIQDLKKELAENRMELERLRKDQFSYWRGSGCVAGTPGEAYAELGRPAQFLDHQFADMSVRSWRASPPTLPAPPSVPFMGVNMSSPPPTVYGATPAPYPVYPFPHGPDVPADPSSHPSGRVPKRRQNDNCY